MYDRLRNNKSLWPSPPFFPWVSAPLYYLKKNIDSIFLGPQPQGIGIFSCIGRHDFCDYKGVFLNIHL
tara:strand:+ start:3069 stop:3272 length:204 start_codon:yes stop_codon:yes gene_type:complete